MENVEESEGFYAFSYTLCDDTIQLASTVWIPPPEGILKCNVDAAMLDNHMGFGVVIRDHEGGEVEEYGFTNVLTIRCDCDHRKMVKSGDFLKTACMNLTELQRYWSPSVFENRNVTDLDGLRLSPRVLFSFRKIIRRRRRSSPQVASPSTV
nr:uncharacterized protein LOC109166807 [Ipomoea batatas]